jgi:predicted dienelactone hydrolase
VYARVGFSSCALHIPYKSRTLMPPLEIVSAVLSSGAAFSLMHPRVTGIARWLAAGSLVTAGAQAVVEGAHWQIAGEYIAAILVCAIAFLHDRSRMRQRVLTVSVLSLDASAVVLSLLLPIFSLPPPTGPYAVGTTTFYWNDTSRLEDAAPGTGVTRELKVQVWYPAEESSQPLARYRTWKESEPLSRYQRLVVTNSRVDAPVASSGAPFPVILFNPGWDSRRTIDSFLAEDLASHGYVVAATDHPYNARLVSFPGGRVIPGAGSAAIADPDSSTPEAVVAIWNRELEKWEADERFVLDQLQSLNATPGSPWLGKIDSKDIAAVGHSFGGAVATALCAHDPRVHGAVNMDGWFFGAIQERGARQPLMVINTGESVFPVGKPTTVAAKLDARDGADVITSFQRYGGILVEVHGAQHDDFTDESMISPLRKLAHRGTIPSAELQAIVRVYVLAFMDKTLRGKDPRILNEDSSPFRQVSTKNWPAAEQAESNTAGALRARSPE